MENVSDKVIVQEDQIQMVADLVEILFSALGWDDAERGILRGMRQFREKESRNK